MYGSPFVSGYGGLSEIYQWRHLPLNLQQYPARFVDAHAWLTPVGLAAVLIPVRALWPSVRERSALALVAIFVASLIAPHLFYDPVHGQLRFFLPALPFLASGTAVVALFFARPGWRGALVGLTLAAYGANVVYQAGLDVRSERKYSAAGEAARARSERGSILFAMQHSGSARYYAGRMTLRYDLLDPGVARPERGLAVGAGCAVVRVARRLGGEGLQAPVRGPGPCRAARRPESSSIRARSSLISTT